VRRSILCLIWSPNASHLVSQCISSGLPMRLVWSHNASRRPWPSLSNLQRPEARIECSSIGALPFHGAYPCFAMPNGHSNGSTSCPCAFARASRAKCTYVGIGLLRTGDIAQRRVRWPRATDCRIFGSSSMLWRCPEACNAVSAAW
jgi:hypothetical protein